MQRPGAIQRQSLAIDQARYATFNALDAQRQRRGRLRLQSPDPSRQHGSKGARRRQREHPAALPLPAQLAHPDLMRGSLDTLADGRVDRRARARLRQQLDQRIPPDHTLRLIAMFSHAGSSPESKAPKALRKASRARLRVDSTAFSLRCWRWAISRTLRPST